MTEPTPESDTFKVISVLVLLVAALYAATHLLGCAAADDEGSSVPGGQTGGAGATFDDRECQIAADLACASAQGCASCPRQRWCRSGTVSPTDVRPCRDALATLPHEGRCRSNEVVWPALCGLAFEP